MGPTQDISGSQRRPMDLEDYLTILRRNVGWLVGPLMAGLVISVVVAFFWPDTYVSSAAIRVVPPQVPEKLVPTNVNMQMVERIGAMQQTILSRNTLTNIINTHDLYRKERSRLPMEDIIEQMQKDVRVSLLGNISSARGAPAFRVSFSYENRYVAQQVTQDLMTRFIDENIRERSSQSQMTTQFLREQFELAKADLDGIQQKLTQFRIANAGRLPEEMGRNMQQMSATESRIATLNSNIGRASQEKMMLESDLRGLREKLAAAQKIGGGGASGASGGPGGRGNSELARVDGEIAALQRSLDQFLQQYTPEYPDVQTIQRRLEAKKKEREEILNRQLAISESPETPAPAEVAQRMDPAQIRAIADLEAQIGRVQTQIRAKELESDRYIKEIADNETKMKDVQGRLDVGPLGAQQLEDLRRDEGLANARYDKLKAQLTQSEAATDLEQRKQGETLEVLDYPNLPATPTAPNRPLIIIVGGLLGFGIGGGIVVLLELKNTSLRTLKDVRAYTRFNVLGSVPLLENDLVVRRRRRLGVLAWSTATILSLVVVSGSIYFYYTTKL